MYARVCSGSRIRTRVGTQASRGRGFSLHQEYKRSDFNKFAVLSSESEQDGGVVFSTEQGEVSGSLNDGKFGTVKGKG